MHYWPLSWHQEQTHFNPVSLLLVNVNLRSRSLYAIAGLSVVCLSVTFVRLTHAAG